MRNKIKIALIALLIVLSLFFLIKIRNFFVNPNNFTITNVQIIATYSHISPNDLKTRIVNDINGNFFTIDNKKIMHNILQIPWAYAVNIRKKWPDTLIITVQEQQPIAVWNDSGLININNKIFDYKVKTFPGNLPHLYGNIAKLQEILIFYKSFSNMLLADNLVINRLVLDNDNNWRLGLVGGIKLKLGSTQVLQKMQTFIKAYPKIIKDHRDTLSEVDLRYSNGMAVRWK
ncbi:MAG: cell division protein FtsQ/DivIB [Gammaproteobacteria bacterium]|nr:cell division protein FtsQ/DivIB [Gammaproteobacteria bacterium]